MTQLTDRFNEAVEFALQLHSGQLRKVSGEPYAAHLLGVASIALDYGAVEDEAIAALLHDAIEDQGAHWQNLWHTMQSQWHTMQSQPCQEHTTLEAEIERRFGPAVLAIVRGCTDADSIPKPPWQERKEAFIARLEKAHASVRFIVAADKLHNVRSLLRDYRRHGDAIWDHFKAGKEKTLWYYRTVEGILRQSGNHPLIEELSRAITELEQLVGNP